nr:gamma-glutamyl-gamma-aminobutyrate hydrolase family protein [uncultured Dethiosulfovibrio sp.]
MIALLTPREVTDSHGVPTDVIESTYIDFFESLGLDPWAISNFHSEIPALVKKTSVDVVVLTGGGSLPPHYYDSPHDDPLQLKRDRMEERLIDWAIGESIPILGICRGMQHINALFGGKISRLTNLDVPRKIGLDHPVMLSNAKEIYVNNFHNDGILEKSLAKGLDLLALDRENGVVEGFCCNEKKILGLQWHPERSFEKEESARISTELVKMFISDGGVL